MKCVLSAQRSYGRFAGELVNYSIPDVLSIHYGKLTLFFLTGHSVPRLIVTVMHFI